MDPAYPEENALVCVVDDDAAVRKGLILFFRSAGFLTEAYDSAGAYLNRTPAPVPSCLVLDVQMPELDGLDLQRALAQSGCPEPIIFLTGQGDIPMCARAMKAGAVDFLPKPFADHEMLSAIDRALARSREQRRQSAARAEAQARVASLTPRETQVLERVITGTLNKEIAAQLGTSIKTVKVQRGQVMDKLGANSVVDLVRIAQQAGDAPPHGHDY